MVKNKTAKVWTLGNTTVRNPERILGAIKVFKRYYENYPTFSSNAKLQGDFFSKLSTHTESGEQFDISKPNVRPIYEFIEGKEREMDDGAYNEKNGRLWLSPLDSFGFINAYRGNTSFVCEPGNLYIDYPELEGDIWLRQLLKFQYPNPKSEITAGAELRPAVFLLKLMIEMEGLSKFEIGLSHLTRNESLEYHKALILEYRAGRTPGNIINLQTEIRNKAIIKHYELELNLKFNLINEIISDFNEHSVFTDKQTELIDNLVSLGKGSKTSRAKICKFEIKKDTYHHLDIETCKNIFLDYYLLVKGDTIGKDYPDLTKRYISMCRVLQLYKAGSETRLRIDPVYVKIIKNSILNLGPILSVNSVDEENHYLSHLRDINQPVLEYDQDSFIDEEIEEIEVKLKEFDWTYEPIIAKEDLIISKKRLKYIHLRNELIKSLEKQYADSLSWVEIESYLKSVIEGKIDGQIMTPTELEGYIWNSFLFLGGYIFHPSKTRNFHVDTNFTSIFTAAGNQPDMQFEYSDYNLIVEVTKHKGKIQARAESEPVTRHVAVETFSSKKKTIGIFIAPEIHEETAVDFLNRCNGLPYNIYKDQKVVINILPLSFAQYFKLFELIKGEHDRYNTFLKIINSLSKVYLESENHTIWLQKINQFIEGLK